MDAKDQVSKYRNSFDTKGNTSSLDAVIQQIRTGDRGLAEKTRYCNATASTDPPAYKAYKEKELPAVTFSGTFPTGKRKAQYLLQHSGHIVLDIDGLTAEQIPDLLAELAQTPQVAYAFVSPSGTGIKVIARVNPIPQNDVEHKGAYQACLEFFDSLAEDYAFEVDTSGKDCSRLCFLAHDPLAIVNPEAPPIQWDRDAWLKAEEKKQQSFEAAAQRPFTGEVDITALDHIDHHDLDYNQWLSVITACKAAGLTWQQVDAWSRKGGHLYIEGEVEQRWHGLSLDISWGAVVNLAKSNGYTPSARKRYTADPNFQHETSDIETERDENKNTLVEWLQETAKKQGKYLLILGSAAGTTKTTLAVMTPKGLLYIAKTTEEADKVFQTLFNAEEDVIRHRPRLFNRRHKDLDGNNDWETLPLGLGEHERPCIQPELCNLHAERIGTTNSVCGQCSLYAECVQRGYLSQAKKERDTSKVIYAWGEVVVCDEIFAERVKRICTKDDILVVDEVNPLELTQERHLDRDTLFDLTERFRHFHEETADDFKILEKLLDLISTAKTPETFIAGVKQWIDSIEDINALDEKLEKYPVGVTFSNTPENATHPQPFEATLFYQNQEITVPIVDFETADDTQAFFVDPETPIETDTYHVQFVPLGFLLKVGLAALDDPPRRHRKMFSDLKTFLDENANIENAPFTFDPKKQTFEYHLKPTLNHRRVIFNTASDPDNLIGEAYRDTNINITRHTGTPPAWETDLVFQISTGNYLPNHSLIAKRDGELHLKPRAQELIDAYIQPSIDTGLKVLVVAPKAFQDVKSVKRWAVPEMDDFTQERNALLINHHHAEGRNDYQDFDIVFIFHYEPNHYEIQAAAKRIYRNPETPLDFTREKRTVTMGGVRFEKMVYIDARVQAVYNRECRARLMQSAMRLRPNINAGKTIVFLTAEPVDIPVTPIQFHPQDAKHFTGDWTGFKEKLQAKAKATVQERIAAGESKSKAYRDTAPQRQQASKQEKADRNAEIIRLYQSDENISQREIHSQLKGAGYKGSLGTINSIITAFRNSQSVISTSYNEVGKTEHHTKAYVTGIDSETAPEPEERPRPEWHGDPYYSEDAIRERLKLEKSGQNNNDTDAPLLLPDIENTVIEQLNAGNFDRLDIAEKLHIDVEVVSAIMGRLPVSDPRLQSFRSKLPPPPDFSLPDFRLPWRPLPNLLPPDFRLPWRPLPVLTPPIRTPPTEQELQDEFVEFVRNHPNPPPRLKNGTFMPTCDADWDTEIEKMYRDGHSHSEIADDLHLPVEYIRAVLSKQAF